MSHLLKTLIIAIAFAGSILFGSVYSFMATGYETAEGIDLSEGQKEEIIIELEDTFLEITEVGEQEFIASLPEKTKISYQEIVNDSAEKAFKKTLWILNIFVVISVLLSFFLPGMKMTEWSYK